jgi:hypothetical protein
MTVVEASLSFLERPVQSGVFAALRHRTPKRWRVHDMLSNRRSFWSAVAERSEDTALDWAFEEGETRFNHRHKLKWPSASSP